MTARCWQTNSEGAYVDMIHEACTGAVDGLIVNPGAWTHYSYAIRDALEIFDRPDGRGAPVRRSRQREEWRRHSVIADVVAHRISRARAPTATARRSTHLTERRG